VLPCDDLGASLPFFTERLGLRVEAISPADAPTVAVLVGHGVRLRLDDGAAGSPGVLRLRCADPDLVAGGARTLTAPNGTEVHLVEADPPLVVPPLVPSLVVSRVAETGRSGVGRAGMRYRDLVPDRQGGRFIASHITIPDGGPVPDYVHFHRVRFQMIFCRRGWVRVVYEDQGEPFVMQAGDCVLQPPEIRHRVLDASPGLEVVEVTCPARHETRADLALHLPTSIDRGRTFGGQRFVRHQASAATWERWRLPGFRCRDTGFAAATGGLAGVRVVRPDGDDARPVLTDVAHGGELLLLYVLDGSLRLATAGGGTERLGPDDSVVIPPGLRHTLEPDGADLELLEVTLPALV
jgi:mannose-6-phosphate isomerase-like protein (cupin superfamily)